MELVTDEASRSCLETIELSLLQGLLTLAVLSIVQVNPILFTVTCVNCNQGILDDAFALVILLDFGGVDAA
jgi:hypothetical protein